MESLSWWGWIIDLAGGSFEIRDYNFRHYSNLKWIQICTNVQCSLWHWIMFLLSPNILSHLMSHPLSHSCITVTYSLSTNNIMVILTVNKWMTNTWKLYTVRTKDEIESVTKDLYSFLLGFKPPLIHLGIPTVLVATDMLSCISNQLCQERS